MAIMFYAAAADSHSSVGGYVANEILAAWGLTWLGIMVTYGEE